MKGFIRGRDLKNMTLGSHLHRLLQTLNFFKYESLFGGKGLQVGQLGCGCILSMPNTSSAKELSHWCSFQEKNLIATPDLLKVSQIRPHSVW